MTLAGGGRVEPFVSSLKSGIETSGAASSIPLVKWSGVRFEVSLGRKSHSTASVEKASRREVFNSSLLGAKGEGEVVGRFDIGFDANAGHSLGAERLQRTSRSKEEEDWI
jgi:hypothetical protein